MLHSLNASNVCKLTRIAVLYNEEGLEEIVKNALIDNLRDLNGTKEFEALQNETPFLKFLNSALMEAALNPHTRGYLNLYNYTEGHPKVQTFERALHEHCLINLNINFHKYTNVELVGKFG